MGFYTAAPAKYTKFLDIPADWESEQVFLHFDGVMLNVTVEINGSFVGTHHYGYTPFCLNITSYLAFGAANRFTVFVNPSMQPNSRWYTGAGIFRSAALIQASALLDSTARVPLTLKNPMLWDAQNPNLYQVTAKVTDLGIFKTHFIPTDDCTPMTDSTSFLLKACDRIGLYVFNEAFDSWNMAKQTGDYSQFFASHWKEDMKAFIERDRNHPSILFWSTGNEITERGGLGNGYELARTLADYVRSLDSTRLVSNGLCSFWNALDDEETKKYTVFGGNLQNASNPDTDTMWEQHTEAFANCLDVVGYNYLEHYYNPAGTGPEKKENRYASLPTLPEMKWNCC